MPPDATADRTPLQVVCLCAGWCNVCGEWRSTFEAQARAHPSLDFTWLDVEDEDEAMGDLEIETFPTVLIARGGQALFLGPVQPSGAQLARLVERLDSDGPSRSAGVEADRLVARLLDRALLKR